MLVGEDEPKDFITEVNEKTAHGLISQQIFSIPEGGMWTEQIKLFHRQITVKK